MVDSRRLELAGACYDAGSVLATVGVRGPVDYTIVHGKVTVKAGRLTGIDEETVSEAARKTCDRYLAGL